MSFCDLLLHCCCTEYDEFVDGVDFGRPHMTDSVVFTNLSLGWHVALFAEVSIKAFSAPDLN